MLRLPGRPVGPGKGLTMIFTSFTYVYFLLAVVVVYWTMPTRRVQNGLLLAASYLFYGWVHPWFCILIASSTVTDYVCALGMKRYPGRKRWLLVGSLVCNLGLLGVFKYFNFFADNMYLVLRELHLDVPPATLRVFLPVGISFYTFQTLSYTIDVYRGKLEARTSFLDVALYVAFFPQLVAGPIERATRLLPQVERPRKWSWLLFDEAAPLLVSGYLKKLVVADNLGVMVDKIYMHEHPTLFLLAAGTLAFAFQIYADFSAYTDIARGSGRLLGFDLMENFRAPYLAISPSDFWRRWHISFSTWIRDYLYIPLGGSRAGSRWRLAWVVIVTFGLSGLWHGAAWHFVLWGLYHAAILFAYHALGKGGSWRPRGIPAACARWTVTFVLVLVGWMLFRAPSLSWLFSVLATAESGLSGQALIVTVEVVALTLLFLVPIAALYGLDRLPVRAWPLKGLAYGCALVGIVLFAQEGGQDFIYFQF